MMRVREGGDPRLETLFGIDEPLSAGIKPTVRLPKAGLPAPLLIGLAALGGAALFWTLEARRQAPVEPSITMRPSDRLEATPEPPPLYIPPLPAPAVVAVLPDTRRTLPLLQPVPAPVREQAIVRPDVPRFAPQPLTEAPLAVPQPAPRSSTGTAMTVDGTAAPPTPEISDNGSPGRDGTLASGGRIKSSALANRSTTVAQGMLIPAVLETALDSTRPGFARAIVSRDIKGFDGTQTLIPRGSRLLGDYRSDTSAGQRRAMISWTRLIRPDGVTIKLDSPAVDPVGRSGVAASVNSHFVRRFAEAILQTSLDIGRTVATRSASGSVIVAVPGSVQSSTGSLMSGPIVPTLRVPAGKSIGVFVAHDLEFAPGAPGQ